MSDNKGLYGKFIVYRTDGKSDFGKKHHYCSYYVVDLNHDDNASLILRFIAGLTSNPNLHDDLMRRALEIEDLTGPRNDPPESDAPSPENRRGTQGSPGSGTPDPTGGRSLSRGK